MMHIVLVEPEIPPNTGNIARTCAATGSALHLVEPLGFSLDDKHLKRAGLDYWHALNIQLHPGIDDVFQKNAGARFFFATTKAKKWYCDAQYQDGDFLVFGRETAGLPEALLRANEGACVRLPMQSGLRSLNLANAVAVMLYEALRQQRFQGLE